MARSLRDITRYQRVSHKQIFDFESSIKGADDRAAAITLGAIIDTGLERVLRNCMRKMNKTDRENLFERGPLSSFSSRLKLSFALGLVGPKTKHDLETINDIRNAFAHSVRKLTFKNRTIGNRMKGLHIHGILSRPGRKRPLNKRPIRTQFVMVATVFGAILHHVKLPPKNRLKPLRGDLGQ